MATNPCFADRRGYHALAARRTLDPVVACDIGSTGRRPATLGACASVFAGGSRGDFPAFGDFPHGQRHLYEGSKRAGRGVDVVPSATHSSSRGRTQTVDPDRSVSGRRSPATDPKRHCRRPLLRRQVGTPDAAGTARSPARQRAYGQPYHGARASQKKGFHCKRTASASPAPLTRTATGNSTTFKSKRKRS